jgi:hypothetical protein
MKKKRATAKLKLVNFISGLFSVLFSQPEGMAYARVRLPVSHPRMKRRAPRRG